MLCSVLYFSLQEEGILVGSHPGRQLHSIPQDASLNWLPLGPGLEPGGESGNGLLYQLLKRGQQ